MPVVLKAQQPDSAYIAILAVVLDKLNEANDSLYSHLKHYNLIMLGEMHGINETPAFILGLASSFQAHHRKVVACFEVPSDITNPRLKNLAYNDIADSYFFRSAKAGAKAWRLLFNCYPYLYNRGYELIPHSTC